MNLLILGLLGAGLFYFRNPQKDYLNHVSIFLLLLFSIELIKSVFRDYYLIIWVVISLGLILFYTLRFLKKIKKRTIDYFKLVSILWIIFYPIDLDNFFDKMIIVLFVTTALGYLSIPLATITFLYDRFVLKPDKMKKRFVITLLVQLVIMMGFFLYGFIQRTEASKQKMESMKQRELTEREHMKVLMEKERSMMIINELEKKLKNCKQE